MRMFNSVLLHSGVHLLNFTRLKYKKSMVTGWQFFKGFLVLNRFFIDKIHKTQRMSYLADIGLNGL